LWKILKEKDDIKDLRLDVNIVLKWILKHMMEGAN
jgi:hypothetical protein